MSALSQVMSRQPIRTDRLVVLTEREFWALVKFDVIDVSHYSWGHAGPAAFEGREVIRVETIGR